jgi:hypothetical protein
MKKLIIFIGILAVSASLMGCSGMSQRDKGTLIGAGVGGVAGNLIAK